MKKILLALLVLVLIVGAGVGGYFIGKSGNGENTNPDNKVTEAQVVEVIDEFCESVGWVSVQNSEPNVELSMVEVSQNSVAESSSSSKHAEIYESDEMYYTDAFGNSIEELNKVALFLARFALSSNGVKESTFYISSAKGSMQNSSGYTVESTMGFYYRLGLTKAEIYIYDFASNRLAYSIVVNVLPGINKAHTLSILMDYVAGPSGIIDGYQCVELKMNPFTKQVYQYTKVWMETEPVSQEPDWAGPQFQDFAGAQLDDIYRLAFLQCNIEDNYLIRFRKEDLSTENVYTFDVLKNMILNVIDETVEVNFSNSQADYIETDVMKQTFLALGYKIIEE